jgi:hypothetical protein
MFTFASNIFNFNIQDADTFLYLFTAEWRKTFIDSGNHNYKGFKSPLKTFDYKIINTGNYCIRNHTLGMLDNQLSEKLGTYVESHFINILPQTEVGEHYDIYDADDETVNVTATDFINTSILFPVFGKIVVESNNQKRLLKNEVFTVIDTSKMHNGYNDAKTLSWCTSSLVYGKTYDEVKTILQNHIIEDLDV